MVSGHLSGDKIILDAHDFNSITIDKCDFEDGAWNVWMRTRSNRKTTLYNGAFDNCMKYMASLTLKSDWRN